MSQIFISYSHTDSDYVRRLASELEARSYVPWFDEHIETGDRWFKRIADAIKDSSAVVVVMTPEAEQSEWVEKEILVAQKHNKPIYPLLLNGREFDLLISVKYTAVRGNALPPAIFYEKLAAENAPAVSMPRTIASTSSSKRQTIPKWLLGISIAVIVLFLVVAGAFIYILQDDSAEEIGSPVYSTTYSRVYDFPEDTWEPGVHEYTIAIDCPNDIHDAVETHSFVVNPDADIRPGSVEFRLTGLQHNNVLLDSQEVHPAQRTKAMTTISIRGGASDYEEEISMWQRCVFSVVWDDNPREILRTVTSSVTITVSE